jgi:two-component system chemotaxis response regulator CheB
MLSGLDKHDTAIAIKSLRYGAVDFISKPSGVISYDIEKLTYEIISKVKAAARVSVTRIISPQIQFAKPVSRKKIVIIGASTGGPKAVTTILSSLPRDISAAVIAVVHMGKEFVPSFVESLRWGSSLQISIARGGEIIAPGQVLVAPGGCHTSAIRDGHDCKIRLSKRKLSDTICPSIDFAMKSVAKSYGKDVLGVLLTGMGSDGAVGMSAIKEAGGSTIAEDSSTCAIFGMPKAAIEMGSIDEILPLHKIAKAIMKIT